MSDSQNWYFTAETNAKGYTYIKAYQTKWDPEQAFPQFQSPPCRQTAR